MSYAQELVSGICAAAFVCAAAGASAQTDSRQLDAAMRTTITDLSDTKPLPRTVSSSALEVANAPTRQSGVSTRRAAAIDGNEAARRLRQARLKREQGAAPLPGEQAQSTGERAVNHRYWRRQEALRQEVEQALRRSNETRRPLLASR